MTTDIVAMSVVLLLFGCQIVGGRDDMKETKQYVQNIPKELELGNTKLVMETGKVAETG